jgi:hypothetical protein
MRHVLFIARQDSMSAPSVDSNREGPDCLRCRRAQVQTTRPAVEEPQLLALRPTQYDDWILISHTPRSLGSLTLTVGVLLLILRQRRRANQADPDAADRVAEDGPAPMAVQTSQPHASAQKQN